jgi:hypothetical protein
MLRKLKWQLPVESLAARYRDAARQLRNTCLENILVYTLKAPNKMNRMETAKYGYDTRTVRQLK